jgi:hypothetical protein
MKLPGVCLAGRMGGWVEVRIRIELSDVWRGGKAAGEGREGREELTGGVEGREEEQDGGSWRGRLQTHPARRPPPPSPRSFPCVKPPAP